MQRRGLGCRAPGAHEPSHRNVARAWRTRVSGCRIKAGNGVSLDYRQASDALADDGEYVEWRNVRDAEADRANRHQGECRE